MAPENKLLRLPILKGEGITFIQFYDGYKSLCFSVAVGITGDEDRAGDVVQESFMAVYKQVHEKELRFESVRHARHYLLRTVRNIALDSVTTQSRRVDLEDIVDSLSNNKDQEELYIEKEKLEVCRRALKRLPAKYREVLKLRFFERMTLAEIARHLGKPIPTIQYRERKALEKLQKNRILRTFFHKNGP